DCEAFTLHGASIAYLTTGLAVERRLVDHDGDVLACRRFAELGTITNERCDHAFSYFRVVAEELGRADAVTHAEPDGLGCSFAGTRPACAGIRLLLLHSDVEAVDID